MIRHIFIATIKPNVSDSDVEKTIQNMRNLKNQVPEIKDITVGRSLGWLGSNNTVSMIVDVENQDDFDNFINSEAHQKISSTAGDVFQTDNFVISQIEF
ncbi:Dabb family protein [Companilactobacillus sp. HBUAS59699]|uniref:Dabb family protein n=1 Tax=Companilactobacillus sp. HBUAS59699 TaxID=3109358 RepID=UPI002FF30858